MPEPSPNAQLRAALPWVLAAVIILATSVAAGFFTAYLVASSNAVDAPDVAATRSPRPARTAALPGTTPGLTSEPTAQPRRTPTPVPVVTPEPSPFVHVVARGEFLAYIAELYCTTVEDIVALNGITNPNRIGVGEQLLIPGGGCPQTSPTPITLGRG